MISSNFFTKITGYNRVEHYWIGRHLPFFFKLRKNIF